MDTFQYSGLAKAVKAEGFSRALETFYGERDRRDRMRVKTQWAYKAYG